MKWKIAATMVVFFAMGMLVLNLVDILANSCILIVAGTMPPQHIHYRMELSNIPGALSNFSTLLINKVSIWGVPRLVSFLISAVLVLLAAYFISNRIEKNSSRKLDRLLKEIEDRQKAAEEKRKEEVLNAVSEANAVLSSIRGYSEVLSESSGYSEKLQEKSYADAIYKNADEIEKILQKLK